jgi:hypothetical protein
LPVDSGGCLRKFRLEHARPLGCRPIRFASSVHGGDAARVPRTNGTNPRLDSDLLPFALGDRIAVTRGSPVARECLLVVERMLRHPPRVSIRGHHSRSMPDQHVDPARNWAKEDDDPYGSLEGRSASEASDGSRVCMEDSVEGSKGSGRWALDGMYHEPG